MASLDPGYTLYDPYLDDTDSDDARWREVTLSSLRRAIRDVSIIASQSHREGAIGDAEVSDILVFCAGWAK